MSNNPAEIAALLLRHPSAGQAADSPRPVHRNVRRTRRGHAADKSEDVRTLTVVKEVTELQTLPSFNDLH